MRYVPRALLAGGLGLAAAFLVACGASSGLLSASEASSLTSQLNNASSDISSGDCGSADRVIQNLERKIAGLPGSVNPTLVSDLSKGAATVRTLAGKDCGATTSPQPDTTSTSTTTTTTPTVTHTTTTTPTTTSTPTSTLSTPTSIAPPTPTTPSTPATTTPAPGTTSTSGNGGAGLPTTGFGTAPGGDGPGNTDGN